MKHGPALSSDQQNSGHVAPPLMALLVPISKVTRDPNQPRRDWRHDDGEQRLTELTNSVKEFGILQPLLVHDAGDHYVVIAGGRRLVAAQRAGLAEIPVIVRNAEGAQRRILQLLENLQRVDLTPVDEGRAFQELMDLEGLSPARIALQVRRSEQHVRDRLRLIADQVLTDAVARGQITASVAREILKLQPLEYATELRRRVEAGQKLQMGDIEAAREQMRQDGVVHPRYTRGASIGSLMETQRLASANAAASAEAVESPVSVAHAQQAEPDTSPPSWLDPEQRRPVRSDREALARLQQDYQRYRATMTAPGGADTRPRPAEQDHGAGNTELLRTPVPAPTSDRLRPAEIDPAEALHALLDQGDRAWLVRVLTLGAENGWTCAGLLHQIRAAV